MKCVRQPDNSRLCGQACLATISGKSLKEIVKIVGHKHGTKTKELISILQKFGFSPDSKLRVVKKDKLVPKFCILKLKYKDRSSWHWVVYKDRVIYDPALGKFNSKDFYNHHKKTTRISSYLDIDKITGIEALARSIDREGFELMAKTVNFFTKLKN